MLNFGLKSPRNGQKRRRRTKSPFLDPLDVESSKTALLALVQNKGQADDDAGTNSNVDNVHRNAPVQKEATTRVHTRDFPFGGPGKPSVLLAESDQQEEDDWDPYGGPGELLQLLHRQRLVWMVEITSGQGKEKIHVLV